MSETAITISLLALVAVIGLWIGHFKIKGVGLGIGDRTGVNTKRDIKRNIRKLINEYCHHCTKCND